MKKYCFKQLCKANPIQLAARHKSQILHLALMGFLFDSSKKSLLDFHSEIRSGFLFKLGESTVKLSCFRRPRFCCLVGAGQWEKN